MNKFNCALLFPFVFGLWSCEQSTTAIQHNHHPEMSQQQQAYFEKIKTEKVISNPNVQWKNFGPGMSGYNEEFWTHPTDSNVMFMGPDMHVSYGTWDNGKSWQTLKDSDGLGIKMKRVLDIEFSLQNPDNGMAMDWNGWAYKTEDRGRTWQKIKALGRSYKDVGIDPNDRDSFAKGWYFEQQGTRQSELAVDPNNDNIWYVGAGDFWNVKGNRKSAAKPYGVNFKYADYGYILKTVDKGKTWQKMSEGFPSTMDVAKIIVNPKNSLHIIMATSHGVMTSHDQGATWLPSSQGLPNNLPRDLTSFYDKKTGQFILYLVEQTTYQPQGNTVSNKGGVYQSTDEGKTWQNITGNLAIDLTQVTDQDTFERFHRTVGHWLGMSKAESKAQFTQRPSRILPVFNRIVVNPTNHQEIYITYNKKHDITFGHGDVWRTLNGGKTWKGVARHGSYWLSGKDKAYWQQRGNPTNTNITFAHLQPYIDKTGEYSGNRTLAINAKGELFIGVDQQTLISKDKGDSWQQIDDFETSPGSKKWIGRGASNLPGRFMLHETGIKGRRLLSSGEHGLWQTTSLDNWPDKSAVAVEQIEGQNHPHGAHSISTVAVHPNDPSTIYFLSWRQDHRGKLRRTTNGGKTWENIATIFEANNNVWQGLAPQNSLMIDPNNPKNMYFCATYQRISEISAGHAGELSKGEYGVYRSTDGGYTWQPSNTGFHQGASVRRVIMHPDNPHVLYAALNDDNGGLYQSNNQGQSWQKVTIPKVIKAVNNVFIDRNSKNILISTGRNTGSYEEGGVWRSKDNGETWQQIFKAPFVWQAEVSPVNENLIVVTVANQIVSMAEGFMNPGIYLSDNSGNSWKKINHGLGNPDKMVDVKPDPYNENVLWAAGWGSGWFIAYLNGETGWLNK